MNGFKTSRTLVVDDQIEEAIPAVQALGLLGIGSIFHDAALGRDYTVKHSGVHLLILDMVLGERVSDQNDPKNVASGLIAALNDLLDPSPGIVVAVCWTKHPDYIKAFSDMFPIAFPQIKLAQVLSCEKKDMQNPQTAEKLAREIQQALSNNEPSNLLVGWEQLVHEAATKTTSTICGLASVYVNTEAKDWNEGAYAICAALALAERGSRLVDEQPHISLHGLSDALGPLLLDRIEHLNPDVSEAVANKLVKTAEREVELWNTSESLLGTELRAILNSQVNISFNVSNEVCPGNVYLAAYKTPNRESTKQYFQDWSEIIADTFIFRSKEKQQLAPGHIPIFVEITPPCDFAQGKGKLPRFVAGFLIPEHSTAVLRENAAYVKRLLICSLEGNGLKGVYSLVINSHYIVSLPTAAASTMKPAFRLRSAITADMVAWLGAHMMRPGFIQLVPGTPNRIKMEDWSI